MVPNNHSTQAIPSQSLDELVPEADAAFLKEKYPRARVYRVGSEVHVVFRSFAFPGAYQPAAADLLVRLPAGYPDANPDMFWTKPDVRLASGAWPTASEHHEIPGAGSGVEVYTNTPWQRWSRHLTKDQWRPGIHGLRYYVTSIKRELERKV